jgi:hypothetical protein
MFQIWRVNSVEVIKLHEKQAPKNTAHVNAFSVTCWSV